jgi:TPR repeat protein
LSINTAVKNGHSLAGEYLTYHNIRFSSDPNLEDILESLEKSADNNSSRACNTLAEFSHAQQQKEENKIKAARFYAKSADLGCLIGTHWMGVYYMEGFGVDKNLNKAEEFLLKAQKMGNAQSSL